MEFTEVAPQSQFWVPPKYVTGPAKFWMRVMGYDAAGNKTGWGKAMDNLSLFGGIGRNKITEKIAKNNNATTTAENVSDQTAESLAIMKRNFGILKTGVGIATGNPGMIKDGVGGTIQGTAAQIAAPGVNTKDDNSNSFYGQYKDGNKVRPLSAKKKRDESLVDDYPTEADTAYQLYKKGDDTEDIDMYDKKTGKKIGEMRYGERIFDQKSTLKIEDMMRSLPDGPKKFAQIGKFVAKEIATHDDYDEIMKTGKRFAGGGKPKPSNIVSGMYNYQRVHTGTAESDPGVLKAKADKDKLVKKLQAKSPKKELMIRRGAAGYEQFAAGGTPMPTANPNNPLSPVVDGQGRPMAPEGYEYDANGNLVKKKKPNPMPQIMEMLDFGMSFIGKGGGKGGDVGSDGKMLAGGGKLKIRKYNDGNKVLKDIQKDAATDNVMKYDDFVRTFPETYVQGYLNSGKEGMYKNVDKTKYPVLIRTLPDGSSTLMPYTYENVHDNSRNSEMLQNKKDTGTITKIYAAGGKPNLRIKRYAEGGKPTSGTADLSKKIADIDAVLKKKQEQYEKDLKAEKAKKLTEAERKKSDLLLKKQADYLQEIKKLKYSADIIYDRYAKKVSRNTPGNPIKNFFTMSTSSEIQKDKEKLEETLKEIDKKSREIETLKPENFNYYAGDRYGTKPMLVSKKTASATAPSVAPAPKNTPAPAPAAQTVNTNDPATAQPMSANSITTVGQTPTAKIPKAIVGKTVMASLGQTTPNPGSTSTTPPASTTPKTGAGSGVKWDDPNYGELKVLENPDEYKKYNDYISGLSDDQILEIFKDVGTNGADGALGDKYRKMVEDKNVAGLRKNLTDKNIGLAHRIGYTAYKNNSFSDPLKNIGDADKINPLGMKKVTPTSGGADENSLDGIKSSMEKSGVSPGAASEAASKVSKVGSYLDYAMNAGKALIGAFGANKPLPVWEIPEKWKEYVRQSEDMSKQGMTTAERSALEQNLMRNRSASVDAIQQTVGGGGSSGAVLAALDGVNKTTSRAETDIAMKDAEMRIQNIASYGNVLSKNVQLDRQLFEDNYAGAAASKDAYSKLMASGIQGIIDQSQYEKTYGAGTNYDKLMQAVAKDWEETAKAISTNSLAQVGDYVPNEETKQIFSSLPAEEQQKLKNNPIFKNF